MESTRSFSSVPAGLRDILPAEAEERRAIEAELRQVFESWGYREIMTPTFEYFDSLAIEAGNTIQSEIFRFFDVDGSLLGLRPEMTTPIARVVSKRGGPQGSIDRLYYAASVFRQEPPQRGQRREFSQVGLELIGSTGPAADAEVVLVLIESLLKSKLKDFKIAIGRVDFLTASLTGLGAQKELIQRVQSLLTDKDLVEAKRAITASSLPQGAKDDVLGLFSLKGDISALSRAERYAKDEASVKILSELKSLAEKISLYGLEDFVAFDFGMVKDFDYYTGIVFEAYSPNLGFPIGSGGRYDNLISEFSSARPACGFALGLERLHIALSEAKLLKRNGEARVLVVPFNDAEATFLISKESRAAGFKTEIAPLGRSLDDCRELFEGTNFKFIIWPASSNGEIEILDIKEDKTTKAKLGGIKGVLT
ncbi:MAG: ATP phosphoribosyltransferase regulatory subunit [Actinomycetota bacterium]|nr:ATP phosphoribosyltransferase regulatory subunit [Actinomycetota bacterium]